MTVMKKVKIYTDGACSGNPGSGGWGCVLFYGKHIKEMSGFMPETTNNRMEIYAVLQGLKALKEPCEVSVYSDSAYVVNAFNEGWLASWQMKGWKNAKKEPVLNRDLWDELLVLVQQHKVIFHKVKGHSDNPWNNRCDELATGEIKKNKKEDS